MLSKAKRGTRSELYRDVKREWRWRTFAGNNQIIGGSTEGYKNKQDAISNAKLNGVRKLRVRNPS